MKKYIAYFRSATLALVCGLFALAGTGCSLDEELPSVLVLDQIKTQEDLDNLIKGAYAEFNDGSAFKMWGQMMIQLCADDLYATKGQWLSYGEKIIDGVNTQQMWNTMFRCIRNANYVIKAANSLDLDEEVIRKAIGEACFIRAFSYYYLVRLYGGVPLRLEAVDMGSDFYLPRSSVDEVYNQIFTDLAVASEVLPLATQISPSDLGRASKGAAQAIMASARLTYANYLENNGKDGAETQYRQAVDWADSILVNQVPSVYNLVSDYNDLWDVEKEVAAYKEVIFGIRFTRDPNETQLASAGSELAYRFLPNNISGKTGQIATPPNADGKGEDNVMPHPYFYYDYFTNPEYSIADVTDRDEDIDYRLQTTFMTRWINVDNNRYIIACPRTVPDGVPAEHLPANGPGTKPQTYVRKYEDGNGKDMRNHENDFFVIRLSEIYLIKAEALNELHGPTQEAVDAFNVPRARARQADGTPRLFPLDLQLSDITGKNDFRMRILDERGLEFIGEGIRWFDLVRMKHPNLPGKTMHDYRFNLLADTNLYTRGAPTYNQATNTWTNPKAVIYRYISRISDNISTSNRYLLFPIPISELQNNPNLSYGDQNPGW